MKGEILPDHHHVSRYCKSTYAPGGQIQATAFMLRKGEETLSVNWLEFLNCPNRENEITQLQNIYSKKLKIGTHAKIVVLNVGEVRNKVLEESLDQRQLEVLHDPLTDDPSHSGIHNLKEADELIAELFLETVRETYSAHK